MSMGAVMLWLMALQLRSIDVTDVLHREIQMRRKDVLFDRTSLPAINMTMANFESSFRFFWGIAEFADGWDSLNNPYVEFKGHQLENTDSSLTFYNVHELHHCPDEYLDSVLARPDFKMWYPSAICFKYP